MQITILLTALVLASIAGIPMTHASDAVQPQDAITAAQPVAADRIVATVNGHPVTASELDAHSASTQLSRDEALTDLIDLQLLRTAAAASNVSAPGGAWNPEERAGIEFALARTMGIDIPPVRVTFIVDHAWLKDAEDEKERSAGRTQLERLRILVEAGATIPAAFNQLQIDGSAWHIGDHEEYMTSVLPAETHNLASGDLSPVIPGDGGLHLFKIHQRREEPPAIDDVRTPLLARLRLEAAIERQDTPDM